MEQGDTNHGLSRNLDCLFAPASVAVIGATDAGDKPGYAILHNIIASGFKGTIYPVNPGRDRLLGLPCYKDIGALPEQVDLVVIAIPARAVPGVLDECGKRGARAAIIISAGFRETGPEGLQAERAIAGIAARHGMAVLGPNCLGVIDTFTPINATFATGMPPAGDMAFMSQSGALGTSILDIAVAEDIGFASFVSLGNKADLTEIDFLTAWAEPPRVRVVLAYLEGITDGTRFIEVARHFTKRKPLVAIKAGVTAGGSRAVSSHTGSMAGSERAYEAAFTQAGVVRAASIGQLFDFGVALARQPLPANDAVAIVTNAGGPGIMATDAIERAGLRLVSFDRKTIDALRAALPPAASVLNPVDLLGDAPTDRYRSALDIVLADPNVGALIVILTPQFSTKIDEVAQVVADAAGHAPIPMLACFMGEASIHKAVRILSDHGVPNYIAPERAVGAISVMVKQRLWQAEPLPEFEHFDADRAAVADLFEKVRAERRTTIGDAEARAVMEAYGIRVPKSKLCDSADEAVRFAEEIGFPVVMKIASPDILHKTDIGGVKLDIRTRADVRDAFDLLIYRASRYMPDADIWGCQVQEQIEGGTEVILGMNRDLQFGPLVMLGLGGIYVEVLKDVVFRIAPFCRREATEMMQELRSYKLLQGVRGRPPSDVPALADALLRVSQLVTEFPVILEMDINPLVVFEEGRGVMGIDMRLVLAS
ncbi:MAG: acetate--CoA ligase family protein [Syntrophorhabdales bacterium]|jgi:acetyltransferase